MIERPEEDPVIPGSDGLAERRHLPGLLLRVLDLGAEWADAEQPHRTPG